MHWRTLSCRAWTTNEWSSSCWRGSAFGLLAVRLEHGQGDMVLQAGSSNQLVVVRQMEPAIEMAAFRSNAFLRCYHCMQVLTACRSLCNIQGEAQALGVGSGDRSSLP